MGVKDGLGHEEKKMEETKGGKMEIVYGQFCGRVLKYETQEGRKKNAITNGYVEVVQTSSVKTSCGQNSKNLMKEQNRLLVPLRKQKVRP